MYRLILLFGIILFSCAMLQAQSFDKELKFLNLKEQQWIQTQKEPLKIGITEIPNQVLKEEQHYRGYAIDLFSKIESLLGTKFQYHYYDTWEKLLKAGREREIDMIFFAQKTEARMKLYNFSDVVLVQHNKIITNSRSHSDMEIEDLYGKKVATVKKSAVSDYIKLNYPGITLVESQSEPESLIMLSKGKVDYTIAEPVRMSYYIKTYNLNNLYIAGSFPYDYKLRIITRNDIPIINMILNKTLDQISAEEKKSLTLKWGYEKEVFFDKKLLIEILIVASIIILFLIYLFILNRRLQKTKESLSEMNETLEERVRSEVEKNREKELMMLSQSRFAQMGQILNMIAHQWRQPLNSIMLMNQGLLFKYKKSGGILTEEELTTFKEKSMQQIKQMSGTIDDFRDFFMPRKKKETILLSDVLDQLLNIIKPVFTMEHIQINISEKKDISIEGYPNELAQSILNILYNAKDAFIENHMTERVIEIELSEENGKAILSIQDNAGGIPKDIITKIFDPYFSTKEDKNGTGLGLYMSKLIIEKHMGGKLSVVNHKNGALFQILFQGKKDER